LTEVVARIPSQSLSFAMNMDTVAYLTYGNNIRIVPNNHFYIQGSDVDIDKAYALMASIGSNGLYDDKISKIVESETSELTDADNIIAEKIIQIAAGVQGWEQVLDNYLQDIISNNENAEIKISRDYLMQLLASNRPELNSRVVANAIMNHVHDLQFVNNKLLKTAHESVNILQNDIFDNIRKLYDDPRTLFSANYPTTMEPIHEAVALSGKDKVLRNSLNSATNIHVNQTCAVGKKGVGISANSQKAFYALTAYNELNFQKTGSLMDINIYLVLDLLERD